MKFIICIVFSIWIGFQDLSGQAIPQLQYYQIEQVATGDLDSDGIEEKAVVYLSDSMEGDFENRPRRLVVYKLKKGQWYKWYAADNVILGNRDGGVMGDPFLWELI